MTETEKAILAMRADLHSYHIEVREHIAKSEARQEVVDEIHRDVYGEPGQKNKHPGLMGEVASLRRSRRTMVWVFGGIWTVSIIVLSSLLSLLGCK